MIGIGWYKKSKNDKKDISIYERTEYFEKKH